MQSFSMPIDQIKQILEVFGDVREQEEFTLFYLKSMMGIFELDAHQK